MVEKETLRRKEDLKEGDLDLWFAAIKKKGRKRSQRRQKRDNHNTNERTL